MLTEEERRNCKPAAKRARHTKDEKLASIPGTSASLLIAGKEQIIDSGKAAKWRRS